MAATGFSYIERGDGSVVIEHHGRHAVTLRGSRAAQFLVEAEGDSQQAMARWTGNYKHGNERRARNHARNRGRR